MKRAALDRFQRIEFFLYYSFIVLFSIFISVYSILAYIYGKDGISDWFLLSALLSTTTAIVALIIFISYFRKVYAVVSLLRAFVLLLTCLFTETLILEIFAFPSRNIVAQIYVIMAKFALFVFCVTTPVKHILMLKEKIWNIKGR